MRELIERLEEADGGRKYRVTVAEKKFVADNMYRYKFEYYEDKYGWHELKNLSRKTVLTKMVAKDPKLIGKDIPVKDVDAASKKIK